MKVIKILGVNVHVVTMKGAVRIADSFINSRREHYIVTPYSEFFIKAGEDSEFLRALNDADLSIPDGFGVLWAANVKNGTKRVNNLVHFRHFPLKSYLISLFYLIKGVLGIKFKSDLIKERVAGKDFAYELMKLSVKKRYKVFFLGAAPGVGELAAKNVLKSILSGKFTEDLRESLVVGTYSGSPRVEEEKDIISLVKKKKPDILLVAFSPPSQEKWIHRNYKKLNVPLVVGVGGTFDYWANVEKMAPKFMQNHGLEWFFRLIRNPRKRLKRQLAIPKFIWEVAKG